MSRQDAHPGKRRCDFGHPVHDDFRVRRKRAVEESMAAGVPLLGHLDFEQRKSGSIHGEKEEIDPARK